MINTIHYKKGRNVDSSKTFQFYLNVSSKQMFWLFPTKIHRRTVTQNSSNHLLLLGSDVTLSRTLLINKNSGWLSNWCIPNIHFIKEMSHGYAYQYPWLDSCLIGNLAISFFFIKNLNQPLHYTNKMHIYFLVKNIQTLFNLSKQQYCCSN